MSHHWATHRIFDSARQYSFLLVSGVISFFRLFSLVDVLGDFLKLVVFTCRLT